MDNKCSWLVVTALSRANAAQRAVLEQNYGVKSPAAESKKCEATIKRLYEELNLREAYATYEESSYQEIVAQIEQLPQSVPKEVFYAFLKKIYKRSK